MQEPQRLLSRLNPFSVDPQNHSPLTGEVLRPEDIVGSLSGLERGPYLLLRYLWCQDMTVFKELYGMLLNETIQLADKNNWPHKNNLNRLIGMINLALRELKTVNLCKPCKGSGVIVNQPCMNCYGSGKKRISQAEQARYCGVEPANWKKHWAYKYQEVFLQISDWNERGMAHLLSRL